MESYSKRTESWRLRGRCFGERKCSNAKANSVEILFYLFCFISKKSDNVELMTYELQSLRDIRDKYRSQQEDLEKLRLENTVRK